MPMTNEQLLDLKQKFALQGYNVPNQLKMVIADLVFDLMNGKGTETIISNGTDAGSRFLRVVLSLSSTLTLEQMRAINTMLSYAKVPVTMEQFFDRKRTADNIRLSLRVGE